MQQMTEKGEPIKDLNIKPTSTLRDITIPIIISPPKNCCFPEILVGKPVKVIIKYISTMDGFRYTQRVFKKYVRIFKVFLKSKVDSLELFPSFFTVDRSILSS